MINKSSRRGAIILFMGCIAYLLIALDASAVYYYSLSASLSLVVGLALCKVNKLASLIGYALVLTNLIGFFMWYLYMSPIVYNNVSMVLLVVQAMCVLPKGVFNGFRNNIQHTVASIARTDNCKQDSRVNNNLSSKTK